MRQRGWGSGKWVGVGGRCRKCGVFDFERGGEWYEAPGDRGAEEGVVVLVGDFVDDALTVKECHEVGTFGGDFEAPVFEVVGHEAIEALDQEPDALACEKGDGDGVGELFAEVEEGIGVRQEVNFVEDKDGGFA